MHSIEPFFAWRDLYIVSELKRMKHKIIKVIGKVQNVGFRFYTNKKAQELSIKGFVKNMADGSVYIEAEADEVSLDHFVLWCKKGPTWARVSDLQIQEAPFKGFEKFEVR